MGTGSVEDRKSWHRPEGHRPTGPGQSPHRNVPVSARTFARKSVGLPSPLWSGPVRHSTSGPRCSPGVTTGRYPSGNTGRARVGLTTPMPIPADLAAQLRAAGIALAP
ncbi:DUF3703 domain-containing protein [Streptomyces sp. NPDC047917]|uniref:DUF3703 domain-containing protein n=1 Tax=Streptomyces sp. NPDC047917 TaxID=3365491 RepID=UPI00371D4B1B